MTCRPGCHCEKLMLNPLVEIERLKTLLVARDTQIKNLNDEAAHRIEQIKRMVKERDESINLARSIKESLVRMEERARILGLGKK